MPAVTAEPLVRVRTLAVGRPPLDGFAAWLLGFALVAYLALSGGGYDPVVRGQVAVAVWWIVLLGAAVGVLPRRFGRTGWAAIALLACFAAWAGLSATWGDSAERSIAALGKDAAYTGFLVLALAAQGRRSARAAVGGVACAIGVVAVAAVLSRLEPSWLGDHAQAQFLAPSVRKLSWPLNYWNALAGLMAMGAPLLLACAAHGRSVARQALAAAALPVVALCLYLTLSRGGLLAIAVGVVLFVLLTADRLAAFAALAIGGAGAAILIAGAAQRDALRSGVSSPAALHQGHELLVLGIVVCAGVALVQAAVGLLVRHGARPWWMTPTPRRAGVLTLVLLVVALAIAIPAGAPGWASDRWNDFKSPVESAATTGRVDVFSRLQSTSGNGRFQYWQSTEHENATRPLLGRGSGSFEFWWAQHATTIGFVRNAHSLYFETLGELGWVGFLLVVGFLALALVAGSARALRAPPGARMAIAAAVAALGAFCVSAAFEWIWEIAVLPAAAVVLIAVALRGRDRDDAPLLGEDIDAAPRWSGRGVLIALSVVALVAVALPLAGTSALRASQADAAHGKLGAALTHAREAQRLQPYAAGPRLQEALVLERGHQLDAAEVAIARATRDEPRNWRIWALRARVQAERGHAGAAVAALRRARALNPKSVLFSR